MASVKPFFLSNFFFFVQFMAFTFAADTTTTKANTHYSNALERTAPITEIKNEKAAKTFFSEKWKTLHAEDEAYSVPQYAGVHYGYSSFSKAEARLNVWQPYVAISDGNSSSSQVEVVFQYIGRSIEAGWMVNGNGEKPRFYVYASVSDESNHTQSCLNLECDAFQLATGTPNPPNILIEPVSTYGGGQYDINITINHEFRDNIMVWAVYLQGILAGYYPESKFGETPVAMRVNFGGAVNFMTNGRGTRQSGTEMGSGHFPNEGFSKAAYIKNMQVYTDDNIPVSDAEIHTYTSNSMCYDAMFQRTQTNWGSYIFYGGPGAKLMN